MQKNNNLTQLDTDQIMKKKFNESLDADRVYLVGGENLNFSMDSDKIAQAVKEGLSHIEFNKEPKSQVEFVEKHIFIPKIEIKEIEKQVFIPQIEYKTIEVPVIIEKIVTIEKPVVIKEIEFKEVYREKEVPKWQRVCIIMQTIAVLGLFISHLIK